MGTLLGEIGLRWICGLCAAGEGESIGKAGGIGWKYF
jgi:hypothetical protein